MKKLFSLFAIAAGLVACQPEPLVTAFKVDNAKAEIQVKCVDITTGEVVKPTLTTNVGTVTGQNVYVSGNPALPDTEVTVSTTYKNTKFEGKIKINAIKAGAQAVYGLVIPVGTLPGDYTLKLDYMSINEKTEVSSFDPFSHAYSHSYSHAGYNFSTWAENNSEWALEADFDVTVKVGEMFDPETFEIINPQFESLAHLFMELQRTKLIEEGKWYDQYVQKYHTQIAAWSLYCGYVEYTTTTSDVDIVAVNPNGYEELVATIQSIKYSTTEISYLEIAHPNAHGHFVPGHGHTDEHGHGAENAGGGIVSAE